MDSRTSTVVSPARTSIPQVDACPATLADGISPPWTLADSGFLFLRAFTGLSLALAHGFGKLPPTGRFVTLVAEMGLPAPALLAWAAGLAESLGGLLLVVGLCTRPAAFFILATMSVATFIKKAGDPYLERELPALFGAVALFFLLAGAGRFSLDAIRARRRIAGPPERG